MKEVIEHKGLVNLGWVKLSRNIVDHPYFWEIRPIPDLYALIDLLVRVNSLNVTRPFDGDELFIPKGCMLTSLTKLADRWGWSRGKVRRFLTGNRVTWKVLGRKPKQAILLDMREEVHYNISHPDPNIANVEKTNSKTLQGEEKQQLASDDNGNREHCKTQKADINKNKKEITSPATNGTPGMLFDVCVKERTASQNIVHVWLLKIKAFDPYANHWSFIAKIIHDYGLIACLNVINSVANRSMQHDTQADARAYLMASLNNHAQDRSRNTLDSTEFTIDDLIKSNNRSMLPSMEEIKRERGLN